MKRKPGASGSRRKPSVPSTKLQERLARQRAQSQLDRNKSRAASAVRRFRVRASDRGKFVLVTAEGRRADTKKARKGFLVYVAKRPNKRTGKIGKSLAYHSEKWTATKLTDIEAPQWRNPKAAQEFERAKLVVTGQGRKVVRGNGAVDISGVNDFSDGVVDKIARSLKKTIEKQASRRSFIIEANVLIEREDGTTKVYSFAVPIAKADHIAIEIAGLRNFVRQKFYAFMARQLAFDGFVSSGSANHIRRLSDNQGLPPEEWTQDDGELWRGNESEVVKIRQIEWRIEQAK